MRNLLIGLGIIAILLGWWYYRHQQALAALPDRHVLIQAVLDKKLANYKSMLINKCHKQVLEEAKEIADSITISKAGELMLFDTLSRPVKPLKPAKPERLPLKDSLEVKPLLDSIGG